MKKLADYILTNACHCMTPKRDHPTMNCNEDYTIHATIEMLNDLSDAIEKLEASIKTLRKGCPKCNPRA